MKTRYISKIPYKGDRGDDVRALQLALNETGARLVVDGDFGPKTAAAVSVVQKANGLYGTGVIGPKTLAILGLQLPAEEPKKSGIPWFWFLKKYEGQHETNPAFNKEMSSKWSMVGLNLGTISKNWAAWCGLFIAVGLGGVGYQYQKNGAAARNWGKFGQAIEWRVNGFPQGAIIWLNNAGNCDSSSNNHVTMANGDCTATDLLRSGASFSGYGGNQQNQAKVSNYPVKNICAVRWPLEHSLPEKVEKSVNCSSGPASKESTR